MTFVLSENDLALPASRMSQLDETPAGDCRGNTALHRGSKLAAPLTLSILVTGE